MEIGCVRLMLKLCHSTNMVTPPRDFEEMDPTLRLNHAKCFGEHFEPKKCQVHVLVVLPIERESKRQKIEYAASLGDWGGVAVAMTQLAKGLTPTHLEEGNLLTVPGGVFGTAFANGLYIRQEYWELYRIIQKTLATSKSRDRVLVLGSPGIGKSVFGVFLLLLFMTKKKDVAFRGLLDKVVYYFTWSDTNAYEGLFDGSELDCEFGAPYYRHVYLFASPCTKNYNEFAKEGCFQVIMNPWTKAECQSLADTIHSGDQDEWYQKFNLVGGIPRILFGSGSNYTVDALARRVEAAIPRSVDELRDDVGLFLRSVFNDKTKHIVYHMHREERSPSFFYPTYSSFAVESLISTRLNVRPAEEIEKVLRMFA